MGLAGVFIIIGGPKAHGRSPEKPGLEGTIRFRTGEGTVGWVFSSSLVGAGSWELHWRRCVWWPEPGPQDSVFDAVDDFVKDEEAGWAAGVFAEHPEFGFGFVAGTEEGAEFGFGGSGLGWAAFVGVGFAELFEEAECALEGALGGGSIAQEEVVLLDIFGGPIRRREARLGAFMAV